MRAEGARTVVVDLYGDGETAREWLVVLRGVASGDAAWVDAAMALAAGTDAGATSELRNALFLALEPAPEVVLLGLRRAPSGSFGVEAVCGADVTTDVDADRALSLVMARLGTVREIMDAALAADRDRCLRALERGMNLYR